MIFKPVLFEQITSNYTAKNGLMDLFTNLTTIYIGNLLRLINSLAILDYLYPDLFFQVYRTTKTTKTNQNQLIGEQGNAYFFLSIHFEM